MLKFGAQTVKILKHAYLGNDVRTRRRASFNALDPKPGERILDLGCGNGLLTEDLARAVGPLGRVVGLDPSPDMLSAARDRLAGSEIAELVEGDAAALPFDPDSFDKLVSLQVFEYFPDLAKPLDEVERVLRPGGRLVVGDMHWDSLVWYSQDPERMQAMIAAWDGHLARREVPQSLPALLRQRQYRDVTLTPLTICDIDLRPDGLANMMLHLMPAFARQNGLLPETVIEAWTEEQKALARDGKFFFSLSHYVCRATRP